MLKLLSEAALSQLVVPDDADKTTAREILRRRRNVDAQLKLAQRALLMLRSLHTDISALRVDDGDCFEGTGNCEFGHESVGVKLEWPNLAVLADETDALLKEIAESDKPEIWFVFHGDCQQAYRCEADDREEAMEFCAEDHPGNQVHVAVPATCHGELVMEGYGEDPVHCPKCGSRTDFGELPRFGWQIHVCLGCNHSFIAVPDEDEAQQKPVPVADGVREVIADIAFTAGLLLGSGKLVAFPDSRELMALIIDWAHAFEAVFDKDSHGDDYMEMVDDYATHRLLGDHDKAEKVLVAMQVVRQVKA
ncbi:MAG: hypothetical protein FD131_4980 [Rhodocyclaceae bacterium]|nr:MAG: hypothetical protein FD131_4980 [Rhodocyclaceae bacterium]